MGAGKGGEERGGERSDLIGASFFRRPENMPSFESMPAMDLLRSEKMSRVQLIIPVECAHRAVTYLGDLGLLQFKDVSLLLLLLLSVLQIFFYIYFWIKSEI